MTTTATTTAAATCGYTPLHRHTTRLCRKMEKPVNAFLRTLLIAWLLSAVARGQRVPACQNSGTQVAACNCQASNRGTSVTCNSANPKLTRVPSNIPEDTGVLNLNNNNITVLFKGELNNLENLRTLFLQNNNLRLIAAGAFDTLYSLQLLLLGGNQLIYIPDFWFQHLPSIRNIVLSNNDITGISRRAFLTLPASVNDVTIELSGNRLICDCDARALRSWTQSLSSMMAPVSLTGFQCVNADGKELDSLSDNEFICNEPTPSMFETSQTCMTCRDQPTQRTCDSREAQCGTQQPVCQTQVKVDANKKLSIYKTCGSYSDCLLRTRNNYRYCNVSQSSSASDLDCFFCCTGPLCNQDDMGGRTKSYKLYVRILLQKSFETYMVDPQDSRYIYMKSIYTQGLNGIFQGVEGGYDTTFLSIRNESGKPSVSCLVYATVLNTRTVTIVGELMVTALNESMRQGQGFLYQERAERTYVGTELYASNRCPMEVTRTSVGDITWPETIGGITVVVSCPSSTFQSGKLAQRSCVSDGGGVARWQDPDISACQKSDITDELVELNDTVITPNNVDGVLTQLQQLTVEGEDLNPTDVTLAVDVMERALSKGAVLDSTSAMDSTLQVLSNVLDAQDQTLVTADRVNQSASRLLTVADRLAAEGKIGPGGQMLMTAPNLAVGALRVDSDNFQGATLTARTATNDAFRPGDIEIQSKSSTPGPEINSLVLPPSTLTSPAGSRIAMKAVVSDKPFRVLQQSRTGTVFDSRSNDISRINSHVLDASVVGQDVKNLPDPVSMTFLHLNRNASNPACVFWDVQTLQWSSEGCSLATDLSTEDSTTCQCNHLTNFALLMDVYGEGDSLSDTDKRILSIISYIGCGISLLALLLTLLTYILFKKLRRDNPSKILVNLCIALALSNLIFVAGMHPYALNNLIGCKIVAVLLHFSLLSALCWMAVEAFYMYLALVLVFKTYFTNFILKCSLIGWGIPLVIVAVTLGVNETDNYGPLSTGVCWLKGVWFYATFLGPVCLILLINFLAFGLVLRQILGLAERKLNKSDSFSAAQQLRGAVGVAILLGLTWVFALFAIDRASVVFYYLFAIFNSLQGLWIFVFYCLLKKEARNSWRRALPCCQTLDDKSIFSNTRAGYSGAVTKTERSKSTTDNGATTTTAFTSSSMDSEGIYDDANAPGKAETKEKPAIAGAVESSHVKIQLNDAGDYTPNNGSAQALSDQPIRTVHRSEGNITLPAAVSKGVHETPIQHTPDSKNVPTKQNVPTKPSPSDSSNTKMGQTSQASPRPLHFKVGYTLSNTSSTEQSEVGATASVRDSQASVAELIKKMNNTRL